MAFVLRHGWSLGLGPNSKLALTGNYSQNCQLFLKSANMVYDELVDIRKLFKENPDFSGQFQKYEGILDQNKLLTFSRLTRLAVEKMQLNPRLLSGYKHLIVDEYQDINRAQERLIILLAQSAPCYVVGDTRQCIYQWRGSGPRCFERFATQFNAATVDIVENRRSGRSIVKVGNSVGGKLDEPALRSAMIPVRPIDGAAVLVEHDTNADVTEKGKLKQLTPVALGGDRLDKARGKAANAITGILAGEFKGLPCGFCKDCDYNTICRFRSV